MEFESKKVHSKDGTEISYHQIGSGPGLIILHGAMQVGLSQADLAKALAQKNFTCYLPDRRGRGKSGPTGDDYSVEKEVEDATVLQEATGAKFMFGVSSGAIVTLKAALGALGSKLERIAVFEPPWWPETELKENMIWIRRYEEEVGRGETAEAAITGMLGSKMGPPLLMWKYFPRSISVLMTKFLIRSEEKAEERSRSKKENNTNDNDDNERPPLFKDLVPTFRNDIKVVLDLCGNNLQTLSAVQTYTLILGGTRSPDYLQRSVRELEKILPNCNRVELEGIDHGGTFNTAQRGSPDVFANELVHFFSGGGDAASS